MTTYGSKRTGGTGAQIGWEAAWLEIEHQAEHWATWGYGTTGYLIAEALRAAALIGRAGGLRCEHRAGAAGGSAAELLARERAAEVGPAAEVSPAPEVSPLPERSPPPSAGPVARLPLNGQAMQAENELVADLQRMLHTIQTGLHAHDSLAVWQERRGQIAALHTRVRTMRAQHLGDPAARRP